MNNPFEVGYYTSDELRAFNFALVGENSYVARNCTIVGLENISIGCNVRIDSGVTIIAASGALRVGHHVQVGIGCVIGARGGVTLGEYSSLSHQVRVLSAVDDYSGLAMTNSTLPECVLAVVSKPIIVGAHVPVGTGSLLLPGVHLGEGSAVAAMSVVNRDLKSWTIYGGNPVQELGRRSRRLLGKSAALG